MATGMTDATPDTQATARVRPRARAPRAVLATACIGVLVARAAGSISRLMLAGMADSLLVQALCPPRFGDRGEFGRVQAVLRARHVVPRWRWP